MKKHGSMSAVFRRHIPLKKSIWTDVAFAFMAPGSYQYDLERFEESFARWLGVKHAIMTPSARSALMLILRADNMQRGDRVILPAHGFGPIASMFQIMGADIVFADISSGDYHMSPDQLMKIEEIQGTRTFVMLAHLHGKAARVNEISGICYKRGWILLEDCAESCGAQAEGGLKVGTFGRAGIFSFDLGKPLDSAGGGMAVTNDDNLAQSMKKLRSIYADFKAFETMKRFSIAASVQILSRFSPFLLMNAVKFANSTAGDHALSRDSRNALKELHPDMFRKAHPAHAVAASSLLGSLEKRNVQRRNKALKLMSMIDDIVPCDKENPETLHIYNDFIVGPVKNARKIKNVLLADGFDSKIDELHYCPDWINTENYSAREHNSIKNSIYPEAAGRIGHYFSLPVHEGLSRKDMHKIREILKNHLKG